MYAWMGTLTTVVSFIMFRMFFTILADVIGPSGPIGPVKSSLVIILRKILNPISWICSLFRFRMLFWLIDDIFYLLKSHHLEFYFNLLCYNNSCDKCIKSENRNKYSSWYLSEFNHMKTVWIESSDREVQRSTNATKLNDFIDLLHNYRAMFYMHFDILKSHVHEITPLSTFDVFYCHSIR